MTHKIIVSTQNNRPEYTIQMLERLGRTDGIGNYRFIVSAEPGCDEVIDLLKSFDKCETKININKEKLGCNTNTFKALWQGFDAGATHVFHIEDDILVSKDALECYEHWVQTNDGSFSFCVYNRVLRNDFKPEMDRFLKRTEFTCWAVGFPKWAFIEAFGYQCFHDSPVSWDVTLGRSTNRNKYTHTYTFLSRSQNIGAYGVHVPSPEWHAKYQLLPFWAGDLENE